MEQRTNLFRELIKYPEIVAFLKGSESMKKIFALLPNLTLDRKVLYESLYSNVGDTSVSTIQLPNNNKLFVKMECENGMGNNHYSRYWLVHLALAEAFGLIKNGDTTILEITSGSSGIALSMACEQLGYKLKIIVPETLPKGRIDAMTRESTTIVKVPGYIANCKSFFLKEKDKADYYLPNHSEEKADLISSVFSRVAYEFVEKYGSVDNVLLGLGNGSSTYGVSKVFKYQDPKCKVYSFYPSSSSNMIVYGLYADNLPFKHINLAQKETLIDRELYIDNIKLENVYELFIGSPVVKEWGHSSLYALLMASKIAEKKCGESFFSIAYDKIERYSNE